MRPDKHKNKDYFSSRRSDYDYANKQDLKIRQIKDDDKLDELSSRELNIPCHRSQYVSNALFRFLRKHIGEKWDDVYSILVDKIGHIDDLKWYIELHAFEQDSEIQSIGRFGAREVSGFYVLDGILGENRIPKWKPDTDKIKVTYVDGYVIFKDKDLYYKAPLDKSIPSNILWVYPSTVNYKRDGYYVVYSKFENNKRVKFAIPSRYIRQLSHKEKMRWNLPNTEINEDLGLFFR